LNDVKRLREAEERKTDADPTFLPLRVASVGVKERGEQGIGEWHGGMGVACDLLLRAPVRLAGPAKATKVNKPTHSFTDTTSRPISHSSSFHHHFASLCNLVSSIACVLPLFSSLL
jgi:hypothetical protein